MHKAAAGNGFQGKERQSCLLYSYKCCACLLGWEFSIRSEVPQANCRKEKVELQLLMSPQGIDLSAFDTSLYNFSFLLFGRLVSLCPNCEAQLTQDDKQV